jgi:hypothetical protein
MADGDDWGQIGAGVGTGALSGAGTGAGVGAAAMAPVPPLIPLGALLGAIIGGIGGGISGGISAHAANLADDIPRSEGGGKCPEGYVYNPATKACQPTGSTAKAVSTARGIKDKEGKSIFDEAAKKLVTKKPRAGDAAAAAHAGQRGPRTGGTIDSKLAASLLAVAQHGAENASAPASAPAPAPAPARTSRVGPDAKKDSLWGDQRLSETTKWLLQQKKADEEDDDWPDEL